MSIETFCSSHLRQVQQLINDHLGAVVPGWALPTGYLASRLRKNTDDKVLVALVKNRVCAAAHLLRYGDDTPGKETGEIAWLLARPEDQDAAQSILSAAQEQLKVWGVTKEHICSGGLWVPVLHTVPDVWPHIISLLEKSGYIASRKHFEAIYGGTFASISPPSSPPLKGMSIQRDLGRFCTRFRAIIDGQAVAQCECCMDLSQGGRLPALNGWAELSEIKTEKSWRNQGIGTWVLQHTIQWLRFGGYDRCVLSVSAKDESAGAGRFYQRFGWWFNSVDGRMGKRWSTRGLREYNS